jgi:hypothetical protein
MPACDAHFFSLPKGDHLSGLSHFRARLEGQLLEPFPPYHKALSNPRTLDLASSGPGAKFRTGKARVQLLGPQLASHVTLGQCFVCQSPVLLQWHPCLLAKVTVTALLVTGPSPGTIPSTTALGV